MFLLIVYLLLAICVSFLCSMLEAGLLSVPRAHVVSMVQAGSRAGKRLEQMKREIDRPLSAILTLNTIAHTVGAAGVGAKAADEFGDKWLGLTSAILTLLILVLSEIIPKTLGTVYAKPLAGFTARTTHALILMLWPIVRALEWLNRLIGGRCHQAKLSRAEVQSIMHLGEEEGVLTQSESRVMRNLLALRDIEVREIMTPRKVVASVGQDQTVAQVVEDGEPILFARMPVHGGDLDQTVGLVTRYDIHHAHRHGKLDVPIRELMRPIHVIPEHASVGNAIDQFLEQDSQLFQVIDEYGGTAGVVTLEDAIETLLGVEIVDETDTVIDMQQLAKQLLAQHQRHAEARQAGKRRGDA